MSVMPDRPQPAPHARPATRHLQSVPLPPRRPAWADRLSAREDEVLRCLARGLSNAEIARELWVSVATVKSHVARLLVKMDARDRLQLVVEAYRSGYVVPA